MVTRILLCGLFALMVSLVSKCAPDPNIQSSKARNYQAPEIEAIAPVSPPRLRLPIPEMRTAEQSPAGQRSKKLSRLLNEIDSATADVETEAARLDMLFQQFEAGFTQLYQMELNRLERAEVRDFLHATIYQTIADIRAKLAEQPMSDATGNVNVQIALLQEYMMEL